MYALGVDVVPSSTGYDAYGNDLPVKFKLADLKPGQVRLRSGKRPRPVTLERMRVIYSRFIFLIC